jgi:hypothetical protein
MTHCSKHPEIELGHLPDYPWVCVKCFGDEVDRIVLDGDPNSEPPKGISDERGN